MHAAVETLANEAGVSSTQLRPARSDDAEDERRAA